MLHEIHIVCVYTMKNVQKQKSIEEFSISGNILIGLLIAVAQSLDAVVSHKNVQKPLGNG